MSFRPFQPFRAFGGGAVLSGSGLPARDNVLRSPSTMTGYTLGAVTVSADVEYNTNYRAWRAFDGSTDETFGAWASSYTPCPHWLKIDFGAAQTLYSVALCAITYAYPTSFTVQYSTDNSNWSNALVVTGASGWSLNTYKSYDLTTPAAARYWRIYFTAGTSAVAICECRLRS
jgi:hypothetical protein